MTFTEAALEVLEREGRAMHAREIAERAVNWGLLSHVGKTPVQTMSGQVSASVAKGSGKSPFVRVRPGVFALAKWGGKPPGPKSTAAAGPAKEDAAPKKRKRRRRKKQSTGADKTEAKPATPPKEAAPAKPAAEPAAKKSRRSRKAAKPKAAEPKRAPKRSADEAREVTEVVDEVLRSHTGSVPLDKLVAAAGWRGAQAGLLLDALLGADGLDRELKGLRPRFVHHRGGWALAEREVSAEIVELERQVSEAAERLSKLAERQILRKLRSVPLNALVRAVTVLLRRLGFEAMSPVERGSKTEFHLSVLDRRGGGRFRTAVVIRRDPSDRAITDRTVTELRGALHHYDSMNAMIVTTGTFTDKARAEATVANLPTVALVDGETLVRELVRAGIGVRERRVGLPAFDEAFFAALGA